jgi:hypothetical protein
MRISIPPSGRTSTWYAHLLFDEHEKKRFFGNRAEVDRVCVKGNAYDGLRIKLDAHGSHRVIFGSGSPYIALKCDDFYFLSQGKGQGGTQTSFERDGSILVTIPESYIGMTGRKILADRRAETIKNLETPPQHRRVDPERQQFPTHPIYQKLGVIYQQPVDPLAKLTQLRDAATRSITEMFAEARRIDPNGGMLDVRVLPDGTIKIKAITEMEI